MNSEQLEAIIGQLAEENRKVAEAQRKSEVERYHERDDMEVAEPKPLEGTGVEQIVALLLFSIR